MPFRVVCSGCGAVLLDLQKLKECLSLFNGPEWYPSLFERLHGKCPGCGRDLPETGGYAEGMTVTVEASE